MMKLSSDDEIMDRRFQEYILGDHPYAALSHGSLVSVPKITVKDVKQFYDTNFKLDRAMLSISGNLKTTEAEKYAKRVFAAISKGDVIVPTIEAPKIPSNNNLILLRKEGVTQSHIVIGMPGISHKHEQYHALSIANHIFGGSSFSAWLMKEIRVKRGWSYGAYSYFRAAKHPLFFSMQTIPSLDDTMPAFELMLSLWDKFIKEGFSKEEFNFAKKSLINQSAFMQDTIQKQIEHKMLENILELPKDFYKNYSEQLKKVTYSKALRATTQHFAHADLFAMILCPPNSFESELDKLSNFKQYSYPVQNEACTIEN